MTFKLQPKLSPIIDFFIRKFIMLDYHWIVPRNRDLVATCEDLAYEFENGRYCLFVIHMVHNNQPFIFLINREVVWLVLSFTMYCFDSLREVVRLMLSFMQSLTLLVLLLFPYLSWLEFVSVFAIFIGISVFLGATVFGTCSILPPSLAILMCFNCWTAYTWSNSTARKWGWTKLFPISLPFSISWVDYSFDSSSSRVTKSGSLVRLTMSIGTLLLPDERHRFIGYLVVVYALLH